MTMASTPAETDPRRRATSGRQDTRRETILSLVELLLQQNGLEPDKGPNFKDPTVFEDEKDESIVDEEEIQGAETFHSFQKKVNSLDKELRSFSNASRQLGSSAAILSSAFDLRNRLAHLLYLYRENAADLFPKKIKPASPSVPDPSENHRRRLRKLPKPKNHARFSRPIVVDNVDLEDFPKQFELLANDVTTFARCLNEFPEFNDEAVNASISMFASDLKYWASCLSEYSGQFRYPSVQRYLHDLTYELGDHMDNITTTLAMFIEVGVPTIRFAQEHGTTNLLNLSTVAIFFSAVTATTLQFSFEDNGSGAAVTVNLLWFASLVLSVASAVNSVVGLTWKQAMYRSPGHRVPWWVLIWIKRSPLVLLVLSVLCFSIGLCCFAYSTGQDPATSILTTVLTAFTSFGLFAVSVWFISERWTYLRHSGKKWLSDVLIEGRDHFFSLPGMSHTRSSFHWTRLRLRSVKQSVRKFVDNLAESGSDASEKLGSMEANDAAATGGDDDVQRSPSMTFSPLPSQDSPPSPDLEMSRGKQLWKNTIKTIRIRSAVSSNLAALSQNNKPKDRMSSLIAPLKRRTTEAPFERRSRLRGLTPRLQCLENTQEIRAHEALVRHLQFSPDGKFLATSSWDRTSVIFKVGDPVASHRILAHTRGRVSQVAWSPTGKFLLTKLLRGIKIWTEDGLCVKTIERANDVEAIVWFPGGEALLSIEGSNVFKMDITGRVLDQYNVGKIKLHDVTITFDGVRILGVGPLLESPSGLKPSTCRAEKRLIVYNMDTKQIESQTPLVNDVRDVTLAGKTRQELVALISYENKAPPQLWRIEFVRIRDKDGETRTMARPTLRQTYQPKIPVDFAGPSYFGGRNDELVLCAGKAGDILIWDRNSGGLLHHIRAQASGSDLTSLAWNPAVDDPFMFATGSLNGVIRIWTKHPDQWEPGILRTSSPDFDPTMQRTDSPASPSESETTSINSLVSQQVRGESEDLERLERISEYSENGHESVDHDEASS